MPKDTHDVADADDRPRRRRDRPDGRALPHGAARPPVSLGAEGALAAEVQGYEVDDRLFRARPEVDAFKAEHDVPTTPQIWIEGERVGGYQALREKLTDFDPKATTYAPVIILFAVAAATALALSIGVLGAITWQTLGWFISISMILLGMQKLRDVESFSTMFLNYDLLARRWVPYGYVYPWVETGAGILMTGMLLTWLAAPAALFIATIGAVSRVQGGLRRQARAQVRLRGRRLERAPGLRVPDREPDDDGHGHRHAGAAVRLIGAFETSGERHGHLAS